MPPTTVNGRAAAIRNVQPPPNPAGQGNEAVRPIRDEIRRRVEELLGEILPEGARA